MSIHSLGRERVYREPRPLSQLLSATCGGGGHRYSNRWLGREPRRRRPGARGAGYKAGRGGRAAWSWARGRWPCGDRPAPSPSPSRTAPEPCAPRPEAGPGRSAQSHRSPSAAGARGLAACAAAVAAAGASARGTFVSAGRPRSLWSEAERPPCVGGSRARTGLAVVMAPPPPADTAPRGCSARRTPPPPPAWAPGARLAAGNRGRPARVGHGWAAGEGRGAGAGARGRGQEGPIQGIARRVGGRAPNASLGRWRVRWGGLWGSDGRPGRPRSPSRGCLTRSRTSVTGCGWRKGLHPRSPPPQWVWDGHPRGGPVGGSSSPGRRGQRAVAAVPARSAPGDRPDSAGMSPTGPLLERFPPFLSHR